MALKNFMDWQQNFSERADPGIVQTDYLSDLANQRTQIGYAPTTPIWKQRLTPQEEAIAAGGTDVGNGTVHIPAPGGDPVPGFAAGSYKGDMAWKNSLDPNEAWIIQRESNFNPLAYNKTVVMDQGRAQHAFGLGQLIDENREAAARALGIKNPNTTNPMEQLAMFRYYVKHRYGNSQNARAKYKPGVGY